MLVQYLWTKTNIRQNDENTSNNENRIKIELLNDNNNKIQYTLILHYVLKIFRKNGFNKSKELG